MFSQSENIATVRSDTKTSPIHCNHDNTSAISRFYLQCIPGANTMHSKYKEPAR